MDSSARRPTRLLLVALCVLWGCGTAHDRDDSPEQAGGAGAGPDGDPAELSKEAGPFDAGSAPDRNAVTPGNICRRLAEIQCEAERVCCDAPERDKRSCLAALEASCTNDALADRIAARPETGFDPVQAEVVFAELERLASSCDPSVAAFGESLAGLRSMFSGTVETDGNCAPAVVFDKAQAGAGLVACREFARQACLPSLAAWRCVPIAAEGGACFSDTNCEPGLYCNNPNLSLAGSQCFARKELGATCALDNECQSSFCVDGVCVEAERQLVYCPR